MAVRFDRTFNDLNNLIIKLESKNYTNPLNFYYNKCNILEQSHFRVAVGMQYFGLEFEQGLAYFSTNRYFLDALYVDILPDLSNITRYLDMEIDSLGNYKEAGLPLRAQIESFIVHHDAEISQGGGNAGYARVGVGSSELSSLDALGYLIVENCITAQHCDLLREKIDIITRSEDLGPQVGYRYGSGQMRRVYNLIARDKIFQDILLHPVLRKVMDHLFQRDTFHQKYYLASFHANILMPGAEEQIWHIDANVPEPIPSWIMRANSNIIIDDYDEVNGSTEVVEKSHLLLRKPQRIELSEKQFNLKKLVAPKGSIVFWHGHLWHRSGSNKSENPRIALLGAYAASFLRELSLEENPYLSLSPNKIESLDSNLKHILGWDHGAKNYT